MDLKQSINRTVNLLGVSVATLASFAFLPEVFIEDKLLFKLDDALLFGMGLVAWAWYAKGKNRFSRSLLPVVFVYVGLAIKIVGIILEIKEKDDVGDDFGGLILFVCSALLVSWVYVKAKNLLKNK